MAAKRGFLMYCSKGDAIGTKVSVRYRESGRLLGVVVKRGSTVLGEHNGMKTNCIEPTPKVRALFQHILHCCCACSKTSISINKYMQKAGEPGNDAGFL